MDGLWWIAMESVAFGRLLSIVRAHVVVMLSSIVRAHVVAMLSSIVRAHVVVMLPSIVRAHVVVMLSSIFVGNAKEATSPLPLAAYPTTLDSG
jgi:hypothetical protein